MRNLAKNLVARRQALGFSQAKLAAVSHVSEPMISLIEQCERDSVNLGTLYNLARGLNCDVCDLIYGHAA